MKNIAIYDLETTGTNPSEDRVCQIAIYLCTYDLVPIGKPMQSLVNPGIPIPEEASKVHGITDDMVKDAPTFAQLAPTLKQVFDPTDWATYNGIRFDNPMLLAEFERCGITIDISSKKLIDANVVFIKKEPRTLAAALQFYCGEELTDAHEATADTIATFKVLKGQLKKYEDLNTIDDLVALTEPQNRCDLAGKIIMKDGVPVFNFGANFGKPISENVGMLTWMMDKDFPGETKQWINKYLAANGNS